MQTKLNALHAAYCAATGDTLCLRLNPCLERWWFDAAKAGMTPEDVRLVIAERKRGIKTGKRYEASLFYRNICGSDEAIANVLNEANAIRASQRNRVDPGRVSVLRATGRPPENKTPARSAAEIIAAMPEAQLKDYIQRMRKAAE